MKKIYNIEEIAIKELIMITNNNDSWFVNKKIQKTFQEHCGVELEKDILLNLGYAAKIYPLM